MDWSDGEYEHTARELAPVAARVVEALGPLTGARVLDLGCGTGNAALEASRRGAKVVAVDPAARLVEVGRARAAGEGLSVEFRVGAAEAIPAPDASADVVVSVFAVIFAPDADAAVREMLRVVAPGGRIVLTTWTPRGAIAEAGALLRSTMAPPAVAPGAPEGPARWSDPVWIEAAFARRGGVAEVREDTVRFEAPSARAWLDRQIALHPVWRAVRRAHEGRADTFAELDAGMLAALERGDEAAPGEGVWRVTSRYLVVSAARA